MESVEAALNKQVTISCQLRVEDSDLGHIPVRVFTSDRHTAEIVVAERCAEKLDQIRQTRLAAAQASTPDSVAKDETGSNVGRASSIVSSQILPEDIFVALDSLPDQTLVGKIVILDRWLSDQESFAPADVALESAYRSPCSEWGLAEPALLRLNAAIRMDELSRHLLHLWAHLFIAARERARHLFELACQAEQSNSTSSEVSYADISTEEAFAIQLADFILGPNEDSFELTISGAPITTTVLGQSLRSAMEAAPAEFVSPDVERIARRLERIQNEALPAAVQILLSIAKDSSNKSARDTALKLLAYLGTEEEWWTLCQIDYLDLRDEFLTDSDLAFLQILKKLRSLDLSGTAITHHGLEHIQHLTELAHLRLGRTAVTNSSMDYLMELQNLESLDLSETFVRDSGLVELAQLSSLRKLDLRGIKASALGINMLKERKPNCEIISGET